MPLLFHELVKTFLIHLEVLVPSQVHYDIDGKTVGVIEFEDCVTGKDFAAGLCQFVDLFLKLTQTPVKGGGKRFLFVAKRHLDVALVLGNIRIGVRHGSKHTLSHPRQKRLLDSQ